MNDYFNTNPILPTIAILCNIGAFLPIIFILFLVRKTPLHCNCRYLCNAWLVGYLALFSGSIALWIVSMRDENGYLAQSWKSPPHRLLLYEICTACSLFCTVSEIAIAVERIVSIKDPEKYHNMPISTGVLATFSVSLIVFCYFFGIIAFEYDQFLIAGSILISCDILTLVTNTLAVRCTKERYETDFDNLNAKYQVREAFQMSAAMQPLYIAIFCVKCAIGMSSVICLQTGNPYAIGYNDMFYSTANALCASLVTVMLIRNHPSLRKQARILLCLPSAAPVCAQSSIASETERHFESLKTYWG